MVAFFLFIPVPFSLFGAVLEHFKLFISSLCLYVFVCAPCVYNACGSQKRASDHHELALQTFVSQIVSAVNGSSVSWESNKCFYLCSPLSTF